MQNNLPNPGQSDEIDLLQLCRTIWDGKWLIAFCVTLALLLAATYAFFIAQPRYAISVYVDSPAAAKLEGLNQGRQLIQSDHRRERERQPLDLDPYTPEQAFKIFSRSLTSSDANQRFIRQALGYPQDAQISSGTLEKNDWRLKINAPDPKGRNLYKVTVLAEDSALAQQHLALFLDTVQTEATAHILDEANNTVSLHISSIENTLATQRAAAFEQRQDRIAQLREALSVAQAITQNTPQMNLGRPSSSADLKSYLDGSELYARGARALQAELEVLEARKNDDPFIKDLRAKEATLNKLKAIAPNTDTLMLYAIDGEVLVPESPVQPRKALIMALGIILGGILGVFWVLIRSFVRTQRKAKA